MPDQQIGQLLDTLGVTADLTEDDMPTDAVVLLKVVRRDGTVALVLACSESLDWIGQTGMLRAAIDINSGITRAADED
ncbi:hypothetical protein [Streptomyces naphthomycinicus]|uniref:hypothetical protein n=1 Tax=Streptomyces naphthomycinicus TaxID=2872625 RepID=UPI001CEDDD4D|nr:hypothetical protein [Streptomyces sp. TML10]